MPLERNFEPLEYRNQRQILMGLVLLARSISARFAPTGKMISLLLCIHSIRREYHLPCCGELNKVLYVHGPSKLSAGEYM